MDGFYQCSFAKEDFVINIHEGIFHIVSDFGDQMNATDKKGLKELFGEIAFISEEFAPDIFEHFTGQQWFAIINIAQGDHKVQQIPFFIDDEM